MWCGAGWSTGGPEWGGVPRCVVGNAATAALRFAEIYSHFWGPSRSPAVCPGLGSCTLLAIRLSSCGLRYWGGKDLGVLPAPLGFSRCRQQYMFLSPPGSSVCGLLGRSLPSPGTSLFPSFSQRAPWPEGGLRNRVGRNSWCQKRCYCVSGRVGKLDFTTFEDSSNVFSV